MEVLDRKIAPKVSTVKNIQFPPPVVFKLDNGIPVYSFNAGSQEVLQIDISFNISRAYAATPLVAKAVNELAGRASEKYKTGEIDEEIDFYGAFLESTYSVDHSSITLFSLTNQLSNVLPAFADAVLHSIFEERELEIYLDNSRSKFLENSEKVGFLVGRAYATALYGDHYYGNYTQLADFDETTVARMNQYYKEYYTANNCHIVISGKFDDAVISQLNSYFGSMPNGSVGEKLDRKEGFTPQKIYQEKEGSVQSGLRLGKLIDIEFGTAEYFQMKVLNTILGGYFGSRLMSNIREDKGYTYGIGSSFSSMKNACGFTISTEVGVKVTEKALAEIYKEISRLSTEDIPEEELQVVKNYMQGMLLNSSDGIFSIADQFKSVHFHNNDLTFFQGYIKAINETTSKDIKTLANKYLQVDSFAEVVVGLKEV